MPRLYDTGMSFRTEMRILIWYSYRSEPHTNIACITGVYREGIQSHKTGMNWYWYPVNTLLVSLRFASVLLPIAKPLMDIVLT